jgi:MHS family proline/betaine transporter-like MFS transporter
MLMNPSSETTGKEEPISRGSLAVAALSTVVEWYDFTLFLYMATVLSRVFYGSSEGSLSTTLASFAVAYLMRPLGAAVFGHVGDRYGRRRMMLISMALMTFAMLVTALLPTRAQIGPAAGWLLLAMRCVMGFSVGGEYNGVVAYLLEGAQRDRRGFVTSLASAASELGGLVAVGITALTVNLLSPAELDAWGWRLPFFFGAVLAAVVWSARSRMHESPVFMRQEKTRTVPKNPLG